MQAKMYLSSACVKVQPPCLELLKKELRYWHREFVLKNYRKTVVGEYRSLYEISEEIDEDTGLLVKRLITYPGFAHRIKKLIPGLKIIDLRSKLPEPNYLELFKGLWKYQIEGVLRMLDSRGGSASAATGWGKGRLISSILKAWSSEYLKARGTPFSVTAAPSIEITLKNYKELKELCPEREVGLITGAKFIPSSDIIVSTMDSLHKIPADEIGIFVADEVHTASSAARSEVIMSFVNAYKWGVSASPTGKFNGSDKLTEGLFGPIVYESSYQDGVDVGALVPIHVCWLNAAEPEIGIRRYMGYKTRDGKEFRAIINNPGRNRAIGRIFKNVGEDDQVLCLVKTIEHLDYVLGHCPDDTEYCHAGVTDKSVGKSVNVKKIKKKRREEMYAAMESAEIKKMASTYVYSTGVNFPRLNIVINACGGSSEIVNKQIPGRQSRKIDGKDISYLVDFRHPWDVEKDKNGKEIRGSFFKQDNSRERTYKNLGFTQRTYDSVEDLPFLKNK